MEVLLIFIFVFAIACGVFALYLAKRYGRIDNYYEGKALLYAALGGVGTWWGLIITYLIVRPKKNEKQCSNCKKVIPLAAIKCMYCGSDLSKLPT